MGEAVTRRSTTRRRAPAPSRRSRQRGKARKIKEQRERRRRSIGVIAMTVALVLSAGYVVFSVVSPLLREPAEVRTVADFPGPGTGEATVVIPAGADGSIIAAALVDKGIVATAEAFLAAYAASEAAPAVLPGTYTLRLEMHSTEALSALLDPASRVAYRLTIGPGLTKTQIFEKIVALATQITVADLEAASADPAVGLPAEAGGSIEGWLFPATYSVDPTATATVVLQQMVAKTVEVLTAKQVPSDEWHSTLVRASLVERTAPRDVDRPRMAQVIQNRLDKDRILQVDASLAYGLGKPGLPVTDADKDADNPYNLELNTGLPPTPIASASETSINAVLSPESGRWLFWSPVNLDTGELRFAETYNEHSANVAILQAWQDANP